MSKQYGSFRIEQLQSYLEKRQFDKVIELFQQMAEKYQLLEARLEALLDTVDEAICVIDETNKVVVWNKRSEMLYGIKSEKILNHPIDRFFF